MGEVPSLQESCWVARARREILVTRARHLAERSCPTAYLVDDLHLDLLLSFTRSFVAPGKCGQIMALEGCSHASSAFLVRLLNSVSFS